MVIFYEDEQGLPYIDLQEEEQGVAFVQTVRESFEGYTKNEVKKAITAREAPTMLGCLSERDMEYLVSSKEHDDCPVTPHDLRNANAILVVLILQECGGKQLGELPSGSSLTMLRFLGIF